MRALRLCTLWVVTVLLCLGFARMAYEAATPRAVDDAGDFSYPPMPCANPCVIEFSPGGVIDLFAAQGRQLAADHTQLIVDGPCLSACTLLVDLDRANACITRNVVLGYHMSARGGPDGPIFGPMLYDTPGLNAYIAARGGLPAPDSGHMLMLNFTEAAQFYRPCAGAV